MWYSDNQFYNLVNAFDIMYTNYSSIRYASSINPSTIKLLLQGLKIAAYFMRKANPSYQAAVDAMERYLYGSGKDNVLPAEYFRDLGEYIFNKAIYINPDLQPNEIESFLFSYEDYIKAFREGDDQISGNESHKFTNPLRWVIGGWTANVWYDIDSNNIVHVYLKMEDKYDWDTNNFTIYDLTTLGAFKNPIINKVIQTIQSLDIDGVKFEHNKLRIEDAFWLSLEENGLAKSYTNKFEGEIYVLSSKESQKFLNNKGSIVNYPGFKYSIDFEDMLKNTHRGYLYPKSWMEELPAAQQFEIYKVYYSNHPLKFDDIMYMWTDSFKSYIKNNQNILPMPMALLKPLLNSEQSFSTLTLSILGDISSSMSLQYLRLWYRKSPTELMDQLSNIIRILEQANESKENIKDIIKMILSAANQGSYLLDNRSLLKSIVPYFPNIVKYTTSRFRSFNHNLIEYALQFDSSIYSMKDIKGEIIT